MVFLKIYLIVIIVNAAFKKANWGIKMACLIIRN